MVRKTTKCPFPVEHPRYSMVRELGRGGAGTVYLAADRLDDERLVAFKVCQPETLPEQIFQEYRTLRKLRHPGIARSLDFGLLPADGRTYFTMEYVEGPDLGILSGELRRSGRDDVCSTLLPVFVSVVEILDYVHRKDLLHLDLKPSNIVLDDGRARLIDFGLARHVHHTATGMTRGTAYYAAPEVFDGAPVDGRTDLYAFGVTMYRCCTGTYPITGRTLSELAENHRCAPPRPTKRIPDELLRIVRKLLAKSPHHRFQNAREVVAALLRLMPGGSRPASNGFVEPDFVGRRRELDMFFRWIDALRSGKGERALVVEAAPGEGKTRLVDAYLTELAGLGIQAVVVPTTSRSSMNGLARILEKISVAYPLEPHVKKRFRFLFTSVGLSPHKESQRELQQSDLGGIRQRRFCEMLDCVARSVSGLLVLVLEDFDACDQQLTDFVRRFLEAPREKTTGMALIVTCRDRNDLGFKVRPECIRIIRPRPLSTRDLVASLDAWTPYMHRRQVSDLVRSSGGNPGYLVHSVRQALCGGNSELLVGSRDLRALLAVRASSLTAEESALVLVLRLASTPVAESFLASASGLSKSACRKTLYSLVKAGLLRKGKAGVFLDQEILGDLVLERYDEQQVREVHERIGDLLQARRGRLGEAAGHLLRGGRTEDGLAAAREAERTLLDEGKLEEALVLCAEVLAHVGDNPSLTHFLESMGDLRTRAGLFDDAVECYERLLRQPDLRPETRTRALRKLGAAHQRRGDNLEARRTLETAYRLLDDLEDIEENLYVLNELAALHLYQMEIPLATTFANRGIELLNSEAARRLSRESYALHALNLHSVAGQTLLRQFEYSLAAKELSRSLAFARQVSGNLSSMALILNNLGVAYHQSNQLRKALTVYGQADRLARQMGDETARFSIQCNTAAIQARLGAFETAREIFAEVEAMPHWKESKRARLFFTYSRGLLHRLVWDQANELWSQSVSLAEELSDPLFSGYARIYLLENEIVQGRWGAARDVLDDLAGVNSQDPHFQQALLSRQAYLEALCGYGEKALELVREALPPCGVSCSGDGPSSYGELWNQVFAGAALMEAGGFDEAKTRLDRARTTFARTRQIPGLLECILLLADLALRRGDSEETEARLEEARRLLRLHDAGSESCGSGVRLPYLGARLDQLSGEADRTQLSDRLADAAGKLPFGVSWEIGWLLDLVASHHGEKEAARRLETSRGHFLSGLRDADRKRYVRRNHHRRLGLLPTSGSPGVDADIGDNRGRSFLDVLSRLRNATNPKSALELLLKATDAARVTLVRDGDKELIVERRRRRGESISTRESRGGIRVRVRDKVQRPAAILCVEGIEGPRTSSLSHFLEVAAALIERTLETPCTPVKERVTAATRVLEETHDLQTSAIVIADSPRMGELLMILQRTRNSRLPVLLTGESGTGKDHIARWMHSHSPSRDGPFLAFDCASVPDGLLEAELFGYEAGAFTGAEHAKPGCLAAANRGTLYLDNIDSLPLEDQVKLLTVLERAEFRPLGGRSTETVDVRFVASSQRSLDELCARKEFRNDLYYRLAGIRIRIPPLRERASEIVPLLAHFQRLSTERPLDLRPDALEVLKTYSWPGNVRELESLVRRLAVTLEGPVGEAEVLDALGHERKVPSIPRWIVEGRRYDDLLRDVKREHLLCLYEKWNGDVRRIAKELGTTRRNVYHRFSQVGLKPVDLRGNEPPRRT